MLNEFYKKIVENKRIAIVGDGSTKINVDGYDLRVFINCHWRPEQGALDILYAACPSNPEKVLKSKHLKFVWLDSAQPNYRIWKKACAMFQIHSESYFRAYSRAGYKFINGGSWTHLFQKQYDFIPFTGVLALRHLMDYPVTEIYLTGMDLYQQETGNLPQWRGPFEIDAQRRFLRDALQDNRVRYDEKLMEVLEWERK